MTMDRIGRKIRVGAVNYLNTKPLSLWAGTTLRSRPKSSSVYRAGLPTASPPGVTTWRLIPSVEFFQNPAVHDRFRRLLAAAGLC